MYLTPDQTETGKRNFYTVLGQMRGDYLRESLAADHVGRFYFGYGKVDEPIRAAIIGTGNEGTAAMIEQSPPDYLRFVGYHDIRPSNRKRARRSLQNLYGKEEGDACTEYPTYEELLADDDVEAVVVATPLSTHAPAVIEALQAGKHVLCEKLMCHNITAGKAMVRAAEKAGKLLSVGHQRHYSPLYEHVKHVVQSGVLGEVRHIQALWHRNNSWLDFRDPEATEKKYLPEAVNADLAYWPIKDGWHPLLPKADQSVEVGRFNYRDLAHLIRWRLYNDTSAGLMAELGSHQLDAVSLFMDKLHPTKVRAVGVKTDIRTSQIGGDVDDDRECDDHVYCTFEFPNKTVMTYSSINSNSLMGYGEIVYGTRGTLMVMNEKDVMLFKEREPGEDMQPEEMSVQLGSRDRLGAEGQKEPYLKWDKEGSLVPDAALALDALEHAAWFEPVNIDRRYPRRGYKEEMEAFAYAVRSDGEYKVRCGAKVALADAVMALTSNVAAASHKLIEFQPEWYDAASNAVPDEVPSPSEPPAGWSRPIPQEFTLVSR